MSENLFLDFEHGDGGAEERLNPSPSLSACNSSCESVECDRLTSAPTFQRFGFITDTHYDYKYDSRKDDTISTLLNKTDQCYQWFKENGCSFVIHGGDMFDRHKILNLDLLRNVRNTMLKSGLKTYYIIGQHDLHGYNKETLHDSNLGFISDVCDGRMELVEDEIDTGDYYIVASHVDVDPVERVKSVKKHDKPVVCVCHALLTEKREAFGTISIKHFKNGNVNLVLSGDLHDGVPFTKCNGIQFYNPGALARTTRGMRMPKVGMFEWNGTEFMLKEFLPECPSCEEIFFWEEAKKEEDRKEHEKEIEESISSSSDDKAFIEAFRKFHSETKDIHELLLKLGKERGIAQDVLELISMHKNKNSI